MHKLAVLGITGRGHKGSFLRNSRTKPLNC
jgi:hypothetical protein